MDEKPFCIYTAFGTLEAEMIKAYLEANDIPAYIYQESAGMSLGLTMGPMGEAKIFIPAKFKELALKLIETMDHDTPNADEQ